jgi:hypothetical protein
MNKLMVAVATAFCWVGFCASASSFCGTGDASQECSRPFGNTNSSTQADGETSEQGFDAQTGDQWSSTSHKVGDFTFYSGLSSANSWDSRQRGFGSGLNGPGFGSQNHANIAHCAFYGTC